MATWKKVIVSGSSANLAALQVDNLTSGSVVIGGGTAGNLSVTAINGTGNIVATTGATNVVMTGSFTGSFSGNGAGLTGVVASTAFAISQGTGIVPFSYDGTAARTVAISGAAQLSNNIVTKWNATEGKFVDSSLTDNGTTITGGTSLQLTGASSVLTGSFTGSFKGDGSQLTGLVTTLAVTGSNGSSGSVNLLNQGLTINGTANEIETSVAGQTVTIGLPNDVTLGGDLTINGNDIKSNGGSTAITLNGTDVSVAGDLTVTGNDIKSSTATVFTLAGASATVASNLTVNNNLTVLGTASFQQTTNLEVADRFILLASGSNSAGDGGLVVQQGTQNVGELFAFDSGTTRWAFTSSFNAADSSFTPEAFVAAALVGAGTDPTAVAARYQVAGNIFVGTDQNIWIYS